mmetsp:Transcript_34640/g.97687  ORF Transcript_34640/g.97687 Transcript_34640/m.97687 type:complete len:251 (+) Transcript_34640:794-1546(+)
MLVAPSRRRNRYPRPLRYVCSRSKKEVKAEKNSTLCPPSCSLGSSSSRACSLPDWATSSSTESWARCWCSPSSSDACRQHFLSCSSRLLRARKRLLCRLGSPALAAPLESASRPNVPSPSSSFLYSCAWMGASPTGMISSRLGGRSVDSTSAFTRRSMILLRSLCAAATTAPETWAASPALVWNARSKAAMVSVPSVSGKRKLSSTQSSFRLFCTGVPVSSRRPTERMCCTALVMSASSFFTRCASSSTR